MTLTRWLAYIPVIVALATIYGLCQLGFWQLDRAAQKKVLIERHEQRNLQPPTDLASLLSRTTDLSDYPLHARGHYLNDQQLLLDNRVMNGMSGFNVITPFVADDTIILVDRGWLPTNGQRERLPDIPTSSEEHIIGSTYVPNPQIFTLKEDNYTHAQWPLLIQKIELEKLAPLYSKPIAPLVLRLTSETSPLLRDQPLQALDPERNYGYAFQWFAMALAVLVITLHSLLKGQFIKRNVFKRSIFKRKPSPQKPSQKIDDQTKNANPLLQGDK